jgi:apolipoprotein D and lipocalin family protein
MLTTLLAAAMAVVAPITGTEVQAVPRLELPRYLGRWYEIARLPMYFQRKCDRNVTATYSLNADGTIKVDNACTRTDNNGITANGVARLPEPRNEPAKLQVRFAPDWLSWLPFVWADYWVIALDRDHYAWAMVGQPGRKYLWILSRTPTLERTTFDMLKATAESMGYDLEPLVISGKIQ